MSGIPFDGQNALIRQRLDAPVAMPARSAHWRRTLATHWLLVPALVFAVHFMIVQLAASIAYRHGQLTGAYSVARSRGGFGPMAFGSWDDFVAPLSRWDGVWYVRAATFGLKFQNNTQMERFASSRDTLWPLLPWIMREGSRITGWPPALVGYLFVNLTFFVALVALYRLIADEFNSRIARRALWCLALLPTAFYYQAISTEAPFLCFAALAFLAARRDRWLLAGLAAMLAAMIRSHGVLLIVPLVALAFDQMHAGRQRWSPRLLFLALPLLGPLLYFREWHQAGFRWHDLAVVQARQFELGNPPWHSVVCAIRGCSYERTSYGAPFSQSIAGPDWSWANQLLHDPSWRMLSDQNWRHDVAGGGALGLFFTTACLLLAAVGMFFLPRWMKVYTFTLLLAVLIRTPFDDPLGEFARFSLLLFPLAIVLAKLLDDWITRLLLGLVAVGLLVGLTAQFANWYWVT